MPGKVGISTVWQDCWAKHPFFLWSDGLELKDLLLHWDFWSLQPIIVQRRFQDSCCLLGWSSSLYWWQHSSIVSWLVCRIASTCHFGIDKSTEWSMIPACPSRMCFFSRGDTKGTNFSKILCSMFVYVLCKFVSELILWFMNNVWFDD